MASDAQSDLDEPGEEQVKAQLMRLPLATLAVPRIMRLLADPNAGFVVWEASPPVGTPHWKHMDSLFTAFSMGLGFCGTDMCHEWTLLGQSVLVYVRSLALFKCFDKPVECPPLCYIGVMQTIDVYIPMTEHLVVNTDARDEFYELKGCQFYVGTDSKCARGMIQNAPFGSERYNAFCVAGDPA